MNLAKSVALVLFLVGVFVLMICFSPVTPKIDTTSDIKLKNSLEKIRRSLGDEKAKTFDEDCVYLIFHGTYQAGRRRVPEYPNVYKKLHDLSAVQVHQEAEKARLAENKIWKQTGQSQDKADADEKTDQASAPPSTADQHPPPRRFGLPKPIVGHVKPPDPNLVPDPTWVARPGVLGQLFDPKGGLIFVFADEAALGLYEQAKQAKDQDGIDELLYQSKAFQAENGTQVDVLERRDDPSPSKGSPATLLKVGLKNGGLMGKSFWVSATDVAKLVHPNDLAARQLTTPPISTLGSVQPPATPVDKLETRARAALELGIAKEKDGKPGDARKIYMDVLSKYPETQAAVKAQARIDGLDAKKKKR